MQKAAKTSRFLIDLSLSSELADSERLTGRESLVEHIVGGALARAVNSRQLFDALVQTLIRLAEHAFSMRNAKSLHEASLILLNLPAPKARLIGQYYQALAIRRGGNIDESLPLFAAAADRAPLVYRARALQTLGALYHKKGRLDEALRFHREAARAASSDNERDPLTTLVVNLETTCIKSEIGDHHGALADYEQLWPLVRLVSREHPLYFYFYHNELAVEFGELGRLAEAEAACKIALASPFAPAYPEWSETRQELEAKRTAATPSIVAISRAPEAEPSPQIETKRQPEPSRRLSFSWPASNKASFQRSVTPFPAKATSAFKAVSILDRVLGCIGPRAPPRPH